VPGVAGVDIVTVPQLTEFAAQAVGPTKVIPLNVAA
jgi:hypothetical protein